MKKNVFFILLIIVMIASLCISCKTTGDAVADPSKPTEGPPNLEESKKLITDTRQRAMDFDSNLYFPSEWEENDAKYRAAESANDFNDLFPFYVEVFKKTLPLYAQAKESEIVESRERVINSGFIQFVPDYLEKADAIALEAMAQYENGEYYKAKDTAAAALSEYETLNMGASVFLARQEVLDRGFAQYDKENFEKADAVAQTALMAFDNGDKEKAVSNAEEALLRYNLVLANGWTAYASDRRKAAIEERNKAISERANVASRETFRRADSFLEAAENNFGAEHFNEASIGYVDAEAMYAISRKETEEKRLRAEESIKQAGEKINESSETAAEAERIIEGGSR